MATSRSDSGEDMEGATSLRKDGAVDPKPAAARGLPFHRVLVANRGEIAVRIIRACRELGLESVAVYSDADAKALHVRLADSAARLGPAPSTESYLRIDRILEAAAATGADAVHPGYGFLAERAEFARRVRDAGLTFVGPAAEAIEALGDKLHARRLARDAGVPVVPGTLDPATIDRPDELDAVMHDAEGIGLPLLVKAAAGGGGRGMRRVERINDLPTALLEATREAASAFGDGRVYLEREIRPARHIEVQLLGDVDGTVVALGERDCSIQRRHQKLVEESPAPGLTSDERATLHGMAVAVASAAGLSNAATAEFLREPNGQFHFLEVNTRLQVEHGVTELLSGVDIVREQFNLAAGLPLSDAVRDAAGRAATPAGHVIEVRISAEDPGRDFAPTPGPIRHWVMPSGPGVRVDTAIELGDRVPPEYDNLIAKVMVHAGDRRTAIDRLARALAETEIAGIQTTLPFHRFVAGEPSFAGGALSTEWVVEHWHGNNEAERAERLARLAAALGLRQLQARPRVLAQRQPCPAPSSGDVGTWSTAALDAAVDRWPAV
jgi:acetyl/propionyl-CoA carboxylase alpha subunit